MSDIILPDPRMEMPAMLYPGRKPLGRVKVNWSHPMANELRSGFVGGANGFDDIVTGQVRATYGEPYIDGKGNGIVSNNNAVEYPESTWQDNIRTATLFIRGRATGTGPCNGISTARPDVQTSYRIIQINPGDYFVYYFRDNDSRWISAGSPVIGQTYNVCGTSQGSALHKLFVDGVQIGSSTSTQTIAGLSKVSLGVTLDSTPGYSTGEVEAAYYWNRGLTDAEIFSLNKDWYQFLEPA